MAWGGEMWRRLRLSARRKSRDADIDEEMQFHLEMRAAEHHARGMDATEAAYAARRRFGNRVLLAEEAREASGWAFAESVARDVRLGFRSLRRSPGFVTVALVSLSLGIGANTAVFSFLNALFLRPIPGVADSDRLVAVHYRTRGGTGYFDSSISYPNFDYIRTANRSFAGLLAYTSWDVTVRATDHTESVWAQLVSPDYFSVLGLRPAAGRTFLPSEGRAPGADPVAVIAYDYWQRNFGGDRSIVGRNLQIGSAMFTVIGVAAPGFRGLSLEGRPPELWLPASMSAALVPNLQDIIHQWGNKSFTVAGRLKPGVGFAKAAADLTVLTAKLAEDHRDARPVFASDGAYGVVLFPATRSRLSPSAGPDIAEFLDLLGITAVLVFLIACFNVAGLVLARTMRRQHEMALQLSLGASRGRLTRQLLVENLMLAFAGTAAGLLLAWWSAAGISWFDRVFNVTLTVHSTIDIRVLAFGAIVGFICALILTALPARLASSASLSAAMGGGTSRGVAGGRRHAQHILVACQVGLSVVLLVGASLFVRTLQNARAVDPTIRPQDVLLGDLNLDAAHYDPTRGALFYTQLLERLHSSPGVRDAACVLVVPLGGMRGGTNVVVESRESAAAGRPVQVGFNVITPGYFRTIGLPIVAGRNLMDRDRAGRVPVAVINEEMARQFFAGLSPIGQRLLVQRRPPQSVEVVGVVRDGRFRNYRARMEPTLYVTLGQWYQPRMNLEVRMGGDMVTVARVVRQQIAAIDKNVALTNVRTVKARFETALARERLTASLLTVLGLFALLLAAVGVYGILSYMVALRTRELGIRIALGARPSAVVRIVVGRVLVLVIIGVGAGTGITLALAPLVRTLLFGVAPADAVSFVIAILALAVTAAVAAWLPARRAVKGDPVAALRCE